MRLSSGPNDSKMCECGGWTRHKRRCRRRNIGVDRGAGLASPEVEDQGLQGATARQSIKTEKAS